VPGVALGLPPLSHPLTTLRRNEHTAGCERLRRNDNRFFYFRTTGSRPREQIN